MSTYSNYPSASPETPKTEKKDNRNIIYGALIIALIGTWGYIIYDKNKTTETLNTKNTEISRLDSARNELQQMYDASLLDLDKKTSENAKLDSVVKSRDNEVTAMKSRISSILKKAKVTEKELAEARNLIKELNSKIDDYVAQVEQLKGDNKRLTLEKETVTKERDDVRSKLANTQKEKDDLEALGSVLHASNIQMIPIDIRKGGKEKVTTTAKRADVMRVSFNLDENKIAKSGEKELLICMTGPDGKSVFVESLGSGKFTTSAGEEKTYTTKVLVNYTQNQKQNVSFDWKQTDKYVPGTYKVEVYHNGYKIGEGTVTMKKGGLFS
jgi:hypothetical protein